MSTRAYEDWILQSCITPDPNRLCSSQVVSLKVKVSMVPLFSLQLNFKDVCGSKKKKKKKTTAQSDAPHLFNADVMEKKMRSARHRSQQSGIDSRSHLTYMRNMGVNIMIMSAQKSPEPLAGLKLMETESAVSFSSVLL